ncbi:acyl-CoA dehydrogenase [Asticcacaulis tiandongensis]|uniref:acyl-CoA dehydrogenase n=1 Tax=Asticcacaulis tiandongensis TaxID=2565365 RepID=UPI0011292195|nr:acyl-CoA dehydrogenase [Asticcacaulis tiandongensis]
MTFRAPLKDISFTLEAVTDIGRLYGQGPFAEFDADLSEAVLDAAADLSQDILSPLNRSGDLQGSRLEDNKVIIADGFAEAIAAFAEGGWNSLSSDTAQGGQGLPKTLEIACYELFNAANMAFSLCPTLSQGAAEALHIHGDDLQKALYLPFLSSGDWSATMNLTEPQAGSDLGLLTTQATPNTDGTYSLSGQKIFITWGDHEARDNIIHLVLARLPDAPEGTRGISLFLCPKYLVNADGSLGARNTVTCVGLEHKLGIHASPTCVMAFEGAQAELIGQPHQGLAAMFTMMNAARLMVGVQGVGIAERAFQQALTYAQERRQGTSPLTGERKAPIIDHPDVRLMLALSKAKIEAARALCLETAFHIDAQQIEDDPDKKARLKRREDFLVPIAKAWSTDIGVEVASLGLQVHGGMGFIEETGAAQYYRDARIAPIYEGTNGIQAADLTGRKLGNDATAALELAADIEAFLRDTAIPDDLAPAITTLKAAMASFEAASLWLIERKTEAPADVAAGASAYLTLTGDMLGGYFLLKGSLAAHQRLSDGDSDTDWLNSKIALLKVYTAHILSAAPSRLMAIQMGAPPLTGFA